ncbi:flagellar hook-basal body complex protein FliE [Luteitalea pratensis]|uniref:flagellar hook-basal body complex protein FliE n=1 Tax=Luteitalea pratensis TaxID=1855912 RepID=UPI001F2E2F9E|nr:flagellar hook-basal body complex protein FliE [Luteitalea pratensis]
MAIDAITAKVITGIGTTTPSPAAPAGSKDGGESFGASLSRLVGTVEESHNSANAAVNGMINGQLDVHDAMIALQRADLTLQFGVQVRNKLMNAYQEIMRMPV